MGASKAVLEWHGSTLLGASPGSSRAVSGLVVVVRAPGQELLPLPPFVKIVDDEHEGRGPLQGIASGLSALDRCEAVYVSSSDCPFLHPAFVSRLFRALDDDHDAVLPYAEGHPQPLAAVYRPSLLPDVEALLETEHAVRRSSSSVPARWCWASAPCSTTRRWRRPTRICARSST